MKKIVYLLMPLISLPCLFGCNNKDNGLSTPLTFTCKKDGGSLKLIHSQPEKHITNLSYQINNGKKQHITIDTDELNSVFELATNLKKGDKVKVSGNNPNGFSYFSNDIHTTINEFITGEEDEFTISGNIMSLLSENKFASLKTIPAGSTFKCLFANASGAEKFCCNISDASKLKLPATQLSERCYSELFFSSHHLVKAPLILPATKLERFSYDSMFTGCEKLVSPPKIAGTELVERCCAGMFYGCASLVEPPAFEGSSSTPAKDCFGYMFRSCGLLKKALILSDGPLADGCYMFMYCDCGSLNISEEEGSNHIKFFTCPDLTPYTESPVQSMFSDSRFGRPDPKQGETYYYVND